MKNLMKYALSALMLMSVIALGACSDDNDSKPVVDESVKSFILDKYPGAVIRDADYEGAYLEVEIMHDARIKDVYFNSADEWVATSWDVAIAELPAAVTTAVKEAYPEYRIDDADYVVTPQRESSRIDLERGNFEKLLYLTPEGEIITE